MDILKISGDSLKVMLTAEDMMAYSLDCDTMAKDTRHSVNVLREILRDAGELCDFPSDGARFFVQLYASPKGECEIFVKRLDEVIVSALELKHEAGELYLTPAPANRGIFVYSFESMDPMMQTCKRLQTAKYFGDSAAYKDDCGRLYYLILEERSPLPEEHGGHLCPKNTAYYINEHCRLICRGAVRALGDLV